MVHVVRGTNGGGGSDCHSYESFCTESRTDSFLRCVNKKKISFELAFAIIERVETKTRRAPVRGR